LHSSQQKQTVNLEVRISVLSQLCFVGSHGHVDVKNQIFIILT